MLDTIRYEIFKDDSLQSPSWLEAVEGLEHAMNRLEELATNDPSSDYYLYSNQADKLIRRLRRTSPPPRRDAPRQVPKRQVEGDT